MGDRIIPSAILALGLMVAGFLFGGRYSLGNEGGQIWRLDRYTGHVWVCAADDAGTLGCGRAEESATFRAKQNSD